MFEKLSNFVLKHIFNKSFILGIIFAIGLFSQYIFGNDNLYEQASEWVVEYMTGKKIDFTPEDVK